VSLGAALVPAAIDLDGHHVRHVRNVCLQFAKSMSFGLLVACGNQLGADDLGQSADVPATDREFGQKSERLGG
jgi:hypothetical protein